MYSEQTVSAVRNALQFAAGACGIASYFTPSAYLVAASAILGVGTFIHAQWAARQAAKAKGK